MSSYAPPIKNQPYVFGVSLRSQADTKLFQAAPTLAAGDFKVSIDGGAFANLATLPTVTPAAGRRVQVSLSAAEMNGDNITVVASDAAGAEWCDEAWHIQTQGQGVLLQALIQGLRTLTRQGFASSQAAISKEIQGVRQAVLDLQQSGLRGQKQ